MELERGLQTRETLKSRIAGAPASDNHLPCAARWYPPPVRAKSMVTADKCSVYPACCRALTAAILQVRGFVRAGHGDAYLQYFEPVTGGLCRPPGSAAAGGEGPTGPAGDLPGAAGRHPESLIDEPPHVPAQTALSGAAAEYWSSNDFGTLHSCHARFHLGFTARIRFWCTLKDNLKQLEFVQHLGNTGAAHSHAPCSTL